MSHEWLEVPLQPFTISREMASHLRSVVIYTLRHLV